MTTTRNPSVIEATLSGDNEPPIFLSRSAVEKLFKRYHGDKSEALQVYFYISELASDAHNSTFKLDLGYLAVLCKSTPERVRKVIEGLERASVLLINGDCITTEFPTEEQLLEWGREQ